MYCKKIRWGTLVLTVCFCLLPVKTAFADTMVGGVSTSVTQEIGPGVTTMPWERYGEHYIDGLDYGAVGGAWRQEGETWYYDRSGSRVNGWLQHQDAWYYLQPEYDGAMIAGESRVIDGVQYEFDETGAMI